MKKTLINTACFGLFAAGMAVSSMSQAFTVHVNDDYVGQDFGSFENTDDATEAKFNISGMDYEVSGGEVTFTLRASETDNGFGTESYFSAWADGDTSFFPGDLFLSTDGWNPHTNGTETQPGYGYDGFNEFDQTTNGEDWEYVIHLSGQLDGFDPQSSGTTKLFSTADGDIEGGSIRGSQEAIFCPKGESFCPSGSATNLGSGGWNIFDSNDSGIADSMSITMLLTAGFQDVIDEAAINAANNGISIDEALGFHWTMSCGNDVIEGVLPAPVPAAAWLFGSGLLGLIGFARRQNKA